MRQIKRISLIFTVMLFLSGCSGFVTKSTYRKDLGEREKKIKKLKKRVKDFKEKLQNSDTQLKSTKQELKTARKALRKKQNKLQERQQKYQSQNRKLEQELSEIKETKAELEGKNVVLTLPEKILFNLGEAKLHSNAKETLTKLGDVLQKHSNRFVVVQGHADTIPIVNSWRYTSNWDLSALRASNVVEFLVNNTNLRSTRIIAAGYGDKHPIASNATPRGRQKNRRVEVVLYPPDLDRKQLDF